MSRALITSSADLERLLSKYDGYRGSFLRDELPKLKDGYYVVNLDSRLPTFEGGTHWVGLYVSPSLVYYFDSYGFPPPKDVLKRMKEATRERKGSSAYWSNYKIQTTRSSACGYWCVFFYRLLRRAKPLRVEDIDRLILSPATLRFLATLNKIERLRPEEIERTF